MLKYSKQLSKSNRKKLYGFYIRDKKGCSNFEEYCSYVVKAKQKLISKAVLN